MSCRVAEQLMCRADVLNSTLALNMMMMTVYFPLFHANTRGGNRLTRDMICATYTVAAVSAFFDRRRRRRDAVAFAPSRPLLNYPRLRCLRCLLLLVGPVYFKVFSSD